MVSRRRSLTTSLSDLEGGFPLAKICLGESRYVGDSVALADGEEAAAARFGIDDVAMS